jgi:hypothetical protein
MPDRNPTSFLKRDLSHSYVGNCLLEAEINLAKWLPDSLIGYVLPGAAIGLNKIS